MLTMCFIFFKCLGLNVSFLFAKGHFWQIQKFYMVHTNKKSFSEFFLSYSLYTVFKFDLKSWAIEKDSLRTMKLDLLLRVHLCSTLGFFSVALMRSLKSLLRTANRLASWESEVLTSVLEYTYKSTKGFISNETRSNLKKIRME